MIIFPSAEGGGFFLQIMARHEHLPIYKQSYELLIQAVHVTKDFPREFKFTVGQRLPWQLDSFMRTLYQSETLDWGSTS